MISKKTLLLIIFLGLLLTVLTVVVLTAQRKITTSTPSIVTFSPAPTPTPIVTPTQQGIGIETQEYKQAEKEYVNQSPILQKLPVISIFFSIDYIDETHLTVHSKTSDKQRGYQAAKNWFVDNRVDISKILIDYR